MKTEISYETSVSLEASESRIFQESFHKKKKKAKKANKCRLIFWPFGRQSRGIDFTKN